MPARFPTTSWSLVIAAAGSPDDQSKKALASLCERYWYPLYAFIRRQGHEPDQARDLTQDFFVRLLEKNYMGQADQRRGRFRAFLLTAVKHFLLNEADRASAKKRGGEYVILPIEFRGAEQSYQLEPAHDATPEKIFERNWAVALLQTVTDQLQREFVQAGKAKHFESLKPMLTGESEGVRYGEIADELGLSEGAVKVAIHRLRRRFRELLRQEVAETVADPRQVDEEIHFLAEVLAS
jgi:RNA polymerase sigma-70 factor (ECF subfamily)